MCRPSSSACCARVLVGRTARGDGTAVPVAIGKDARLRLSRVDIKEDLQTEPKEEVRYRVAP